MRKNSYINMGYISRGAIQSPDMCRAWQMAGGVARVDNKLRLAHNISVIHIGMIRQDQDAIRRL